MTSAFLTEAQVAALLGRSKSWLQKHRHRLEREGLPRRDAAIGLRARAAVEAWILKRSGVSPNHDDWHSANGGVMQMERLDALS